MTTLEEALNQATTIGALEEEFEFCVIGHDLRTIAMPSSLRIAGVESDSDVHVVYFKCPRYYGPTDLSEFDFRINYLNANNEGDIFPILEKTVTEDAVYFEWLVSYHACKYQGNIRFIVCARIVDTEGSSCRILKEYNTAVHTLPVLAGLEIDSEAIYEENYDVIETILQTMHDLVDAVDESLDNLAGAVHVGDDAPSSEYAKFWVKETSNEIVVPTYDEFEELEGRVDEVEDNVSNITATLTSTSDAITITPRLEYAMGYVHGLNYDNPHSSTNTIYSNLLTADSGLLYLSIDEGYKVLVVEYDEDGAYKNMGAWLTGTTTRTITNKKYCVEIRKSDNTDIDTGAGSSAVVTYTKPLLPCKRSVIVLDDDMTSMMSITESCDIIGNGHTITAGTNEQYALFIYGNIEVNVSNLKMSGGTTAACRVGGYATANFTQCEFANSTGHGLSTANGSTNCMDCIAHDNGTDGFNYHAAGKNTAYNCWGYDNGDDGISNHEQSSLKIVGGRYYGNEKAGIACPTYGAGNTDIHGAYIADNEQYGLLIFNETATTDTVFVEDCLIRNNPVGVRVSGYQVIAKDVVFSGNTTNVDIIQGGSFTNEPGVDSTLAVSGMAADAKVTGDAVGEVENDLYIFPDNLYQGAVKAGGYYNSSGEWVANNSYKMAELPVGAIASGDTIYYTSNGYAYTGTSYRFDVLTSGGTWIKSYSISSYAPITIEVDSSYGSFYVAMRLQKNADVSNLIVSTANVLVKTARTDINAADIATINSKLGAPLKSKTINCLGDSFTAPFYSWCVQLAERVGCVCNNYGVSNSRISIDTQSAQSFLSRYSSMDQTADIVVIFGGINDAGSIADGKLSLGSMSSALDNTTFYGALRLLIEDIKALMPGKKIFGVIPPDFSPNASYQTTLPQVQQAERAIYAFYQIPYADLKKDCQEMWEESSATGYNNVTYRHADTNDYHPSRAGHLAISEVIENTLFQYVKV